MEVLRTYFMLRDYNCLEINLNWPIQAFDLLYSIHPFLKFFNKKNKKLRILSRDRTFKELPAFLNSW